MFSSDLIKEFCANAYPAIEDHVSYTFRVKGKVVRFDRHIINSYL